jgi:hypothetical protein
VRGQVVAGQLGQPIPGQPGGHPPLLHPLRGGRAHRVRVGGQHQPAQPHPQLPGGHRVGLTQNLVDHPAGHLLVQVGGLVGEHHRLGHINLAAIEGGVHGGQPADELVGQHQLAAGRVLRPRHRERNLGLRPVVALLLGAAHLSVRALPDGVQVSQQLGLHMRGQPLPRLRQPHQILIRQRRPVHLRDRRGQVETGRDDRHILRQPPPRLQHVFDSTQDSPRSQPKGPSGHSISVLIGLGQGGKSREPTT